LNDGSASFEDIGKLLETESNELYAMYEDILTREIKTSLREKALLFMQWICLAERPLSLTEIRIAMACDESCMRLDQDKIEDSKDFVESDERMEKLIRSLSGGLAERRHDSTVQLFHQSVNDFLREGGLRTLFSAVGHSKTASLSDEKIIGRSEQMLSRSCFNYLRLGEIAGFSMTYGIKPVPTVDEVEENFHFLRYATKFCFLHAQRAEYLGVSQVDLAKLIDHPTKFVSSEDSPPQESLDYPPSIFETWTVMFEAVRRLREPNLTPRLRLIHTASDWNLQSTVRYLIEKGEQVDEQDWFGDTPLHHAVRAGHGELVSMLFDFGAEIESENCSLSTPLELAVKNRRVGITKLLLRRGADANRKTGGFSNILEAVCNTNGGAELASHVIKFGAEVNGEGGLRSTGPTALEGAAYAGDEETVRLLISKGANIHVQSEYYGSPLQAAVQGPCSKAKGVVKLLLEKGADINAQCGEYGNALQAAARRSSPEMIEFLLENGADLNIRGGHYGDALQACFASIYDEEVARLLLDHGAEINAQGGHYGSPLQSAADSGNLTTFRMLWEKGARADVKGGVHQSMIQAAGVGGNQDIVQLLLDNGSDINEQGGKYGTALQAAVYFNAERFVEFLLDKGADVNLQGGGFGNALCAAVVIRGEKMIELLLKRGADIHARPSGDYQSAFLLAAEKGNVKQMKALLDHGNDINPQDERYAEALKIAKGRRTKHVAELLLERKKANIARSK
jgi:ankyrin repeat protein